MSAPGVAKKPAAREGSNGVQFREGAPVWMLDLGVTEGKWLDLSKAQLRTMQEPDKPLKVQVWATGMLHGPGYKGEEATTLWNDKLVPLTQGDIIKELLKVAIAYFRAAGIKATDQEFAALLKEEKEHVRGVLAELEDEGVALRTNLAGTPLRDLTRAEQRRLSGRGRTRMFFWLIPRAPKPENVAQLWRGRQGHKPPKQKVALTVLPQPSTYPPIWKILNLFQIDKPEKARMADPVYQKILTQAWESARKTFLEVAATVLPKVAAEAPPEVAATVGAFERKDERKVEREQAPSSAEVIYSETKPASKQATRRERIACLPVAGEEIKQTAPEWMGKLRTFLETLPIGTVLTQPMFLRIASHLTEALLPQFQTECQNASANIRVWPGYETVAKQVAARGLVMAAAAGGEKKIDRPQESPFEKYRRK